MNYLLFNMQLVLLVMAPVMMASAMNRPSLGQMEKVLHSTAPEDFDGNNAAFLSATSWDEPRLNLNPHRHSAYLACAEYGNGREGLDQLESVIPKFGIRRISNAQDLGTCYIVAANATQSLEVISAGRQSRRNGISTFGPIPSALKLAPGLLDYEGALPSDSENQRLTTMHGFRMKLDNVIGLDVSLAPGVLPARSKESEAFIQTLQEDLRSEFLDLHSSNVWSDPAASRNTHRATDAGVLRVREWTRASDLVHELSSEVGTSPGDICSWNDAHVLQTGDDFITITGRCG